MHLLYTYVIIRHVKLSPQTSFNFFNLFIHEQLLRLFCETEILHYIRFVKRILELFMSHNLHYYIAISYYIIR